MIPQLLLCGLFVPRDALPRGARVISDVLPLSYAVDAMQRRRTTAAPGSAAWTPVLVRHRVVAGFALAALVLAATLRRRRADGVTGARRSGASALGVAWARRTGSQDALEDPCYGSRC